VIAQGNALGSRVTNTPALKGRNNGMKITPTQRCGNPFTGARRGALVSPFQGSTYHGTFPRALPWAITWRPFGAFRGWFVAPTKHTGHRRGRTHDHRPNETHGPPPRPHARSSPQRNTRAPAAATRTIIAPTKHTGPRRDHTHDHRPNGTHGPPPRPHARSSSQRYARAPAATTRTAIAPSVRTGHRRDHTHDHRRNGTACDPPI
jgi:hypothetical protein